MTGSSDGFKRFLKTAKDSAVQRLTSSIPETMT